MGLFENMHGEPVTRLALRTPVTAAADTRIREAGLGCVIAVDEARTPTGILTESMLTQLLAREPTVVEDPISAHMSAPCPQVRSTDGIVDVLEAMQRDNERCLGVVDEDGHLTGLTGQKGLMEYVAEHFPQQVMVQRIGGTPYTHHREGA